MCSVINLLHEFYPIDQSTLCLLPVSDQIKDPLLVPLPVKPTEKENEPTSEEEVTGTVAGDSSHQPQTPPLYASIVETSLESKLNL